MSQISFFFFLLAKYIQRATNALTRTVWAPILGRDQLLGIFESSAWIMNARIDS